MIATANLVSVRAARYEDGYALWLWANDGETRRWSGNRAPIHFDQHMIWFTHRLADLSTLLFLAEDESGTPLGSVRFESTDGWKSARLSYVVAPRFRGQRRSRPLVAEAMARLTEVHGGTRVWAEVMIGNAASVQVFRGLQWSQAPGRDPVVTNFWCPV